MNNISIKIKLIGLIVISLVVLSASILSVSIYKSSQSTDEDKLAQLNSITAAKKQHISNYFASIGNLLISTANSASTGDALYIMSRFFKQIEEDNNTEVNINEVRNELISHYNKHYVKDINFDLQGVNSKKNTENYLPKSNNGLLAQYIYILKNNANIGEKNQMTDSSSLDNTYTLNHSRYHPSFNIILEKFSLYDIFLVDMEGTIVYSTFKEKDYATNLKTGPYTNSGLAQANKKAYSIQKGKIAFSDFKPYEPSYNTPAAFAATPVYRGKKRMGNLIMQFPIDVIDNIMNFDNKFEESGLGRTGISYLVGEDHKMRNNSRFIKDIKDSNVISAGTTISTYKIDSESVDNALSGNSGMHIITMNGKHVLSSYSSFKIFDKTWAIISEIDEDEVLEKVVNLNILLIAIAAGILVLITLITLYLLKTNLFEPLHKFENGLLAFFKYLNNETSDVLHIEFKNNDEIGKMSKVINNNIDKVKESFEKDKTLLNETISVLGNFEQGDLTQRITTEVNNPALNELRDVLNKMGNNLEKNIDNILNVLETYTHYDYTKKVDSNNLKEHLLKLSDGVNLLGDSITKMLTENKKTGLIVDNSSDVLLKNVDTLNQASSEAAASLEETAAALEEITGNVRSTTEKVAQMSNYAKQVTDSASQGEILATKTTNAMDEINNQVTSINEAITVIDQIAFQTNILSLNAAVEAATAGEAGKGFAVVAQEVRNLASRSADAAKEIKELVENANIKANEGKNIADEMIEGYTSLNTNIDKTIDLISDVANASKEQETGIVQINDAINSLDQQTQKNAVVANETKSIAINTSELAKDIVSSANEKEFEGKDFIKIDSSNNYDSTLNLESSATITATKTHKTIIEKKDNNDDWESF